ncbi:Regulator of G-protein signaling 3 [Clonorchis sinensis]|uniref:Regulator of G-protein signaling 3 n=2 Tax=Clonorchis sinensis TaxID=79923 RepID=G7Y8B8_CLOSI|nr:Regulator of G-protein signaling 3 [Clonorchis sinensis]GAA49203.1 regulator of G-protein signaling 3 [Clonorchis sinensis]
MSKEGKSNALSRSCPNISEIAISAQNCSDQLTRVGIISLTSGVLQTNGLKSQQHPLPVSIPAVPSLEISDASQTENSLSKKWKWLLKKYKNNRIKGINKKAPSESSKKNDEFCIAHNDLSPILRSRNNTGRVSADPGVYTGRVSRTSSLTRRSSTELPWEQRGFDPTSRFLPRSSQDLLTASTSNRSLQAFPKHRLNSASDCRDHLASNPSLIAMGRGKSATPKYQSSGIQSRHNSLLRGGSFNLVSEESELSSSQRPTKTSETESIPKRSQEKLIGKVNLDKRKLSKITTVFHRSPVIPAAGSLYSLSSGPHGNYRVILNKIFRSHWPTPREVELWSQSFSHVLHDKSGILVFREFLRTEFSDENIEFWLICEDFRNSVGSKKLQTRAQKIFNEFVAAQAKREVNLDSSTRLQLEKDMDSVTKNTFDQSQKRIQALMEKDSYSRFLRSELYSATLELSREQEALRNQPNRLGLDLRALRLGPVSFRKTTESTEYSKDSAVPGLLPQVKPPRKMAGSSTQHETGSHSAPSSPKQQRADLF